MREDDWGFGDGDCAALGGVARVREIDRPAVVSMGAWMVTASDSFGSG